MKRKESGWGGVLNFMLAVLLVAALGFIAGYFLFFSPEKPGKVPEAARYAPERAVRPKQAERGGRPRVAVIIDDVGMNMSPVGVVAGIDAPVAVAVLPGLRHSRDAALAAKAAGIEVLLHLPMQPDGESMKGLGPGALMSGMTGAEMDEVVRRGLESVPGASGVNNHMGSALTRDARAMDAVMAGLKKRGLFFVDSRTTSGSVAEAVARKAGVRAAGRDVFLDDVDDPVAIRMQFGKLVARAKLDGFAIGIGHPRPATLAVLADELPRLAGRGIDVVRVSEIVR